MLNRVATQLATLRSQGREVVLVSSGSVAAGMSELGWSSRPHEMDALQAAAAVGQTVLVSAWQQSFAAHGIRTAQILLTHSDMSDRQRYLNARSAMRTLLQLGIVPVINENDTVVTDEIRFGDNDTLAALVANLLEADALVILTDQQGLFDDNPSTNPMARLIQEASATDHHLDAMVTGPGGILGRGGMQTKLRAARLAARSGALTLIASGKADQVTTRLLAGEMIGTLLYPQQNKLVARKQWLAGQLRLKGQLVLDDGAIRVLQQQGKSLLPVGVQQVIGQFRRGELVACVDSQGREVARGLVNYNAEAARQIAGQPSGAIEGILGYMEEPELIHRDNMVVL
jgi:glutamate 5-kinase